MAIDEPVILVRMSRLYRENMSAEELYEATRGVWKVGSRREGVKYALAVHDAIVREVYEIAEWQPAGTSPYLTRKEDELPLEGRWGFCGKLASPDIRQVYLGISVADYFQTGAAEPNHLRELLGTRWNSLRKKLGIAPDPS